MNIPKTSEGSTKEERRRIKKRLIHLMRQFRTSKLNADQFTAKQKGKRKK